MDTVKAKTKREELRNWYDEGNVARLGLISIQERIPEDHTSWTVSFEIEGKAAQLGCRAVREFGGVPHGLDNDVSLALLALFQAAGSPEDGLFVTTSYQILKLMDLATDGRYYRALRDSLGRLTHTTYTASHAWNENGRLRNQTFRYIEALDYTSPEDQSLDGESVLKVTLGKEIVKSVRAKYIKTLDYDLLTSLRRPLTRALFRNLDAQRQPTERDQPAATYQVGLLQWADVCKIVDKRPDKIRRTLEGAHEELIERGYLERVEIAGRGSGQTLTYHFGSAMAPPPDPEAVELLTGSGLNLVAAQRYAREYSLERVRERLGKFHAILDTGFEPTNRLGFLVDVLKDERGKYASADSFVSASRKNKGAARKGEQAKAEQEQARLLEEQQLVEFAALSPEDQLRRAMSTLSVGWGKLLTTDEFERIQGLLRAEGADLAQFYREVLENATASRKTTFAERLRSLLQ